MYRSCRKRRRNYGDPQPTDRPHVSAVSAHATVRQALTAHQRRIGVRFGEGHADKAGVVMVGRDIGTVVMLDAPLKVFLDATAEERARRYEELQERGRPVDYAQVLDDINRRDQIDSNRALSPFAVAADAIVVDTTELTPQEVVERIVDLVRRGRSLGRRSDETGYALLCEGRRSDADAASHKEA